MTVPPNSLAAISIWTTVWISSRVNRRAPFIIAAAFVAIIGGWHTLFIKEISFTESNTGYIILLTTKTGIVFLSCNAFES